MISVVNSYRSNTQKSTPIKMPASLSTSQAEAYSKINTGAISQNREI